MRVTNKHILFWGEWPSNWYPAEFDAEMMVNGEKKTLHFFNSEQYFMFIKAKTFGDEEIAKEIVLKGKNPKIAKELLLENIKYAQKRYNEYKEMATK